MKKFIALIVPLILLINYGCSKEHEKAIFTDFENLAIPTVTASLDTVSATIRLSWTMSDTTGVRRYLIASSDTMSFSPYKTEYSEADSLIYSINDNYSVNVTPLTLHFRVAAIFVTDKLNWFVGPQSDPVIVKVRE